MKALAFSELKVYSRKQVVAWVHSYQYSFDELKNGLFFLCILRKLIPADLTKFKINEKPLNQYEQILNMNIVKKVLNKYGLQLNLNVQSIVSSKNCFEFANWFKNLYQQNKSDTDTDFHYSQKSFTPSKLNQEAFNTTDNLRPFLRATSSSRNKDSNSKRLGRVTSGFLAVMKSDHNLNSTMKIPKNKKAVVFDSEAAYGTHYGTEAILEKGDSKQIKKPSLRMVSISTNKSEKKVRSFFKETSKAAAKPKTMTQQQQIQKLLRMQSLEQKIQTLQSTIAKISNYVKSSEDDEQIQKFRGKIISLIYNLPS